ncbi:MAG: hypothetical protein AAGK23_13580 [Pseudomonadota bacterium]
MINRLRASAIILALPLAACGSLGSSAYDQLAAERCDEVVNPADASTCRLDEIVSRQERRSERRKNN